MVRFGNYMCLSSNITHNALFVNIYTVNCGHSKVLQNLSSSTTCTGFKVLTFLKLLNHKLVCCIYCCTKVLTNQTSSKIVDNDKKQVIVFRKDLLIVYTTMLELIVGFSLFYTIHWKSLFILKKYTTSFTCMVQLSYKVNIELV